MWFDDSDAQSKMVAFLASHARDANPDEPVPGSSLALDRGAASILDLGCGNGALLFELRDEGWAGRLVGVDYSEKSVALARQIQEVDILSGSARSKRIW